MKLTLTVLVPDNRPIKSTLGRALKGLLRRHGLKCLEIRDEPPTPPPTPAASPCHPRQLPRSIGRGEDEQPEQIHTER